MKMRREWTAVAALLVVVGAVSVGGPGHTQTKRAMTLVDLAEVPRVLDPQLSPDGRFVLYTLTRADWKANRAVGHIWRQETAGGAPTRLTSGESGEANARWSPDGKTVLFLRDGQILLLATDGGEARALTAHATSVSAPAWAPDGTAVYFIAAEPKSADERDRDRLKDDVYALDENYKQRQLWKATVASGAEQRLTEGDSSVIEYRVSRDGRRIALHRAPTPLPADAARAEVWVMDATGANARALTHNGIEETGAQLSPDGTQLLFLADANAQQEPYYNTNLFVVPAAGGTPRVVLPDFRYAVDRASWAPDGRSIFAVVNMGLHSELFQIDVGSRSAKPLTDGTHSVPPPFWSVVPAAGRMVFQFDEPARPGEVWTLPLSGGVPVRMTSVYDPLDREFHMPHQTRVEWKGADGTTIEGLLIYPIDYAAGRRYPLVVQLHGGPNESDKFGVGPGFIVNYFPVLAAKGYAVLRPNYRGSTGYGNAFYRDLVGGYFRNQHLDVMAGIDFLIKQGIADPDRIAVMGWSAGAHLTNKLITFTTRFKAASSTAGVADWTSMYAQTDTRASRTMWFGGTPWQADAPIAAYWDNSPLKDVAKVKTPTLFIVGENDQRVPLPQSLEMYRALKANGVATKLYVGPREGHQWGELRHQLFKANAELEWFEKYVRGRPYVWEKAPGDSDNDKSKSTQP